MCLHPTSHVAGLHQSALQQCVHAGCLAQNMVRVAAAGQDDTVAAVKAVRQAFETISLPAVIDLVPGGIDKGVLHVHSCC